MRSGFVHCDPNPCRPTVIGAVSHIIFCTPERVSAIVPRNRGTRDRRVKHMRTANRLEGWRTERSRPTCVGFTPRLCDSTVVEHRNISLPGTVSGHSGFMY